MIVLFSNESCFASCCGLTRLQMSAVGYAPNVLQQVDRFGGSSVMARAGIHHGGRTALVRVKGALVGIRHRDEILQHHVIGGRFSMTIPDNMLQVLVRRFCSAKTSRHYISLPICRI